MYIYKLNERMNNYRVLMMMVDADDDDEYDDDDDDMMNMCMLMIHYDTA